MKYFSLLIIFPVEVVNIILKFILMNESSEKISHYLKIHYLKKQVLKNSIYYMLNNREINFTHDVNSMKTNISNLNFILKNYYSKKHYNKFFWNNYLNVLSSKIMQIFNNIHLYNKYNKEDKKNCSINLKKSIYYWFELCKKHNVRLQICYMNNNNNISNKNPKWIYEYAKNIRQIKNFDNLASSPKTLYIASTEENNYWYEETYEINSSLITIEYYLYK